MGALSTRYGRLRRAPMAAGHLELARPFTLPSISALNAWWVLLPVATVAPFLVARFPPLADYYHWLFSGRLVAMILSGAGGVQPAGSLYSLDWVPVVPNAVEPGLIGLLNLFLPLEVAGKLFLASSVLLFAFGFGYLVRSAQQRPTALEFLGLPWALGYFAYAGYNGYLLALGVALLAIGRLHRITTCYAGALRWSDLLAFGLTGVAIYLCHLFGWAVFAVAVVVYAIWLFRVGKRLEGFLLPLSLVPSLLLLAWYLPAGAAHLTIQLYDTLAAKTVAFFTPLLLFVRAEPVESALPLLWSNLAWFALFVGLMALILDRSPFIVRPHPMRVVGVVLLLAAIGIPIGRLGEAAGPDQRFTLPAFLVILATLRYKRLRIGSAALAGLLVLLAAGLHMTEYVQASNISQEIARVSYSTIPPDARVLSLSVANPIMASSCGESDRALPAAAPVLKWFGLLRLLDTGRLKANLVETSFVHARFDPATQSDLSVVELEPGALGTPGSLSSKYAADYPYVQVVGCPADLAVAEAALAPRYVIAARGDGFLILSRHR